jgi:ABC-type Zn uptake system ZnuABC Zn-binding protein ZnuA
MDGCRRRRCARSGATRRLSAGVLLGIAGLVALAGCGSSSTPTAASGSRPTVTGSHGQRPMNVVATTTQLTDLATVVGGARVKVTGLLKANVDAHEYEPSPADIDALAAASVVVKNGVGLETWLDDALRAAETKAAVIDASTTVALRPSRDGHDAGNDPHYWQDPRNVRLVVATIAAAFSAADPDGTPMYETNMTNYVHELERLDAEVEAELAPLTNRNVVTNHDALRYFLDRYHLTFVGAVIPSFDSQAELSGAEMADLVATIKARGVKAIFAETSLPAKAAATIAAEAGVKVVVGDDALYGDALGPPGSDGATYLTMIRHNARVLAANLG